jgi:hypothetical protein
MPASAGSFEFVVMVEAAESLTRHAARWIFVAKENPLSYEGAGFSKFPGTS